MTIMAAPTVKDGCLMARGKAVLTQVTENVVVSPIGGTGSAFLGATSTISSCRHVFTLGVLQSDPGSALNDEFSSDSEDSTPDNTFYILFLPVLDGQFRATLQGTPANELQFCIESVDVRAQTFFFISTRFTEVLPTTYGSDLCRAPDNGRVLEKCKETLSHIEKKKTPAHLDWFGWCTWDAFYTEASPQGIKEGLQSFSQGGCSPKFLIIDDGWQDTVNELGARFAARLTDIKENSKFRSTTSDTPPYANLHDFVDSIKDNFGLNYIYMWHALAGYWGGVNPSSEAMKKYNPKLEYPIQSPGNTGNLRDIAGIAWKSMEWELLTRKRSTTSTMTIIVFLQIVVWIESKLMSRI